MSTQLFQSAYTDSSTIPVSVGYSFDLPVYYEATDPKLSGLRLNIHFDSSLLTPQDYVSVVADLFGSPTFFNDTSDLDSDPLTDKYLQFIWVSFSANFPGTELPSLIANVRFDLKDLGSLTPHPISTPIRFTAQETAVGYKFIGSDQILRFSYGQGASAAITGNGAFREGVTLTAPVVTGDPDGDAVDPKYAYQWYKDGIAIADATASTYLVPVAGAGTYKVAITYTDAQDFRSTVDSPNQDILTGQRIIDLNTATSKLAGDDGIIDRFNFQTNAIPVTPWRISEFNPTEDIIQIPQELIGRTVRKALFGIKKVEIPDRPLTKSERKFFTKQQKAVRKSVKRIGRTGDGFAYNQLTGELFVDTNGRKKGFGEGGGLLAVLEDTPAIGISNFEFL